MTGRPVALAAAAGLAAVAAALAGPVDPGVVAQSLALPPEFVERLLAHWWVFPAAVVFSLVALSAGVSGALFFSPFFILVVGLTPTQAIGAGLLTEVFGMGNGLLNYVRQRVVDYATAKWLLVGAVPAVIGGALVAHLVPTALLTIAFGVGLLVLGAFLVYYEPPEEQMPGGREGEYLAEKNTGRGRPPSRPPTGNASATTPAGGRPGSGWRLSADSSPG